VEAIGQAAAPAKPPPVALEAVEEAPHAASNGLLELAGSLLVAVVFAALGSLLWAAMRPERDGLQRMGTLFYLSLAASWAILLPARLWGEGAQGPGDVSGHREVFVAGLWWRHVAMLALGAGVGALAGWLDGWPGAADDQGVLAAEARYVCYYALALGALPWWRVLARRRPQRFEFGWVLAAGFLGFALLLLVRPAHQPGPAMAVAVLVAAAVIVQLAGPWEPPAARAGRRGRLRYI
jgi:hypothetical protein